MVATRENDRMTARESNTGMGMKPANGGAKSETAPRAMTRTTPSTPAPYRQSLAQWEPFRRMREEFDRMYEQFFGHRPALMDFGGRPMHWGWDVQEDDSSITVRAEAPGFEPGDFDVQVRGDQLILSASHRTESQEKDKGSHEWQQQEFYRAIALPCGTDHDKVDATYRNGVLTVSVPKTEECKARHIAVNG